MKKYKENGLLSVTLITLILIILLNIVTFAIPFHKNDMSILITVYVISEILILMTGIIYSILLFTNDNLDSKVYSLPIFYFSFVMTVLQLIFYIVIYICNIYLTIPLWIVIVVESFIIAIYIIKLIIANVFKTHLLSSDENKTINMDKFKARLKAIALINQNENVKKILNNLLEIALLSDPVSNEKTLDLENELLLEVNNLDEAIKKGIEEETRLIIEKITKTLQERNVLCKANKK